MKTVTVTVTVINKEIPNTFLSFLYYKTDNVEDRYADLYYKGRFIGCWNNEYIKFKEKTYIPRELMSDVRHLFEVYIRDLEHELMIRQGYFYIKF